MSKEITENDELESVKDEVTILLMILILFVLMMMIVLLDLDKIGVSSWVLFNPPTDQPIHRPPTRRPADPKFTDLPKRFYLKDLMIKKIFILQITNTTGKM